MLKINLLSENEMAQKSKSEKDGNVDFLTKKKMGKIFKHQHHSGVWWKPTIDLGLKPPEEEAIASKASVTHIVDLFVCLFVQSNRRRNQ